MVSHPYYRVLLRKWKKKLFIYKLFGLSIQERCISTGGYILTGQKGKNLMPQPFQFLVRCQHRVFAAYMNPGCEYMRYDFLGATTDFQIFVCRKVKKLKKTEEAYTCNNKRHLESKKDNFRIFESKITSSYRID